MLLSRELLQEQHDQAVYTLTQQTQHLQSIIDKHAQSASQVTEQTQCTIDTLTKELEDHKSKVSVSITIIIILYIY